MCLKHTKNRLWELWHSRNSQFQRGFRKVKILQQIRIWVAYTLLNLIWMATCIVYQSRINRLQHTNTNWRKKTTLAGICEFLNLNSFLHVRGCIPTCTRFISTTPFCHFEILMIKWRLLLNFWIKSQLLSKLVYT